jgi:hypothetical protein
MKWFMAFGMILLLLHFLCLVCENQASCLFYFPWNKLKVPRQICETNRYRMAYQSITYNILWKEKITQKKDEYHWYTIVCQLSHIESNSGKKLCWFCFSWNSSEGIFSKFSNMVFKVLSCFHRNSIKCVYDKFSGMHVHWNK